MNLNTVDQSINDLTFDEWMHRTDLLLYRALGLPSDHWPDQDYYQCWCAGDTPREMANLVEFEAFP